MLSRLFALNAYAVLAAAAIIAIDVSSPSGAIAFSPNSVTAKQGDTVVFSWKAGGHTVVQGQGSSAACQPLADGFFSGFQEPPTTFAVEVKSTDPIWFYCSTVGHCQMGMVGVINPPSDVTIQDYIKAAASASKNPSPNVADGFGGVINKGGSSSTSGGSSTASGTSGGSSSTSGGSSSTSSGSSSTSSGSSTGGTSSSLNGSTSTTPTTSSTTSSASSQHTASSGQPASHNKGWMAGVVIGAAAGLAIIIGVGFWI